MKLKLAVESGVHIFVVTESVSSKDVEIIKAGLNNLLKNGKNRIILEVNAPEALPDEVIRDIGILDNLARELAGRIVVVTPNEELKKKLEVFASPPLVLCYSDRITAIAGFSATGPLDAGKEMNAASKGSMAPPEPVKSAPVSEAVPPPEPVKPAAAPQSLAPLAPATPVAQVSPVPHMSPDPQAIRDAILARELGEIGAVRRDLAAMKRENQVLHNQLLELVEGRRQTVDSAALILKIRALEWEVEKLLGAPPKTAPKAP